MTLARAISWCLALALLTGCSGKIIPPPEVQAPTKVYVTDYGRHSSLLLPTAQGQLVEYSYGDWEYYALNRYRWYLGATKLIYSEDSGLGRRYLPPKTDLEELRRALDCRRVVVLEVELQKVDELLEELDARYMQSIDSMVLNEWNQQYFVKDSRPYNLFHTCNHQTAEWLERLGCQVEGITLLSQFELERRR